MTELQLNSQKVQEKNENIVNNHTFLNRIGQDWFYLAGLLFFVTLIFIQAAHGQNTAVEEQAKISVQSSILIENSFSHITPTGKSAFVYDFATKKILYEKNPNLVLPLASLSKVMAAVIAQEEIDKGEEIYITHSAVAQEGDEGLLVGDSWKVDDLLAFAIVSSSNDAIHAVWEHLKKKDFELVSLMNDKANLIGASDVYFSNETGLDISSKLSGAYGSAKDYMKILEYANTYHESLFRKSAQSSLMFSSEIGFLYNIENTNKTVDVTPQLVLSKTGFTDLAGGNLAIVFEKEPGHRIGIVVLGSTREGRFTDVSDLLWAGIEYNE